MDGEGQGDVGAQRRPLISSLSPTSIQVFNYLPKGERGNVNPLFRKFCFDVSLSTSQRRTCSDKHLAAEERRQTITMG